jgi:hypothetical protein
MLDSKAEARFWFRVDRSKGSDVCWEWQGSLNEHEFGYFYVHGKTVYAHRISWLLAYGELSGEDSWVGHTCGNHRCVNPAHLTERTNTLEERFWNKVCKGEEGNDCWVWLGTKTARGYGKIYDGEKMEYAHRLSWKLVNGSISDEMEVCHTCDNPMCVNPVHLFIGSHLENVRDMVAKDRGNRGERHGHAKLTDEQVKFIRRLARDGLPQIWIATVFHLHVRYVWQLVHNERWKHIA